MDNTAPVFKFLLGEGPLRGVEFGDRHPDERGAFWWRKDLRDALAAQPDPNVRYGDGFHDGYLKGREEGWDAAMDNTKQIIERAIALIVGEWGEYDDEIAGEAHEVLAGLRATLASQPAASDEHLIETGCYQAVIDRHSQPAASEEPSVHEINREMTNAGWQNSEIRQADLPKVVRVVRALLSRYAAPQASAEVRPLSQYGYQTLFDAISAATWTTAGGDIEVSVQAFRDALKSAPAAEADPINVMLDGKPLDGEFAKVMADKFDEICIRPAAQAPAKGADRLRVGDSSFEGWFSERPYATRGDDVKQIARDAYEAGMNDSLVADRQQRGGDGLHNLVAEKFSSGNAIPVERITITRTEWDAALVATKGESNG